MKKKLKLLFVVLVGMFMMLAACSQNSTGGSGNGGGGKGKDGENVVNIGFTGPLSGPAASYGEKALSGMKLAVEEINETGLEVDGKKYKLNLVSLDDKYLPNEAAANAQRLVQENKTPIVYTPHSGGIMALQVFNEKDNFIIGAYSSEPTITESGNKLTVRIPPRYDGYIEPFTKYSMERFGKKLAAIPTVTQYGKDWAEVLLPYWKKSGGDVVYESAVDFTKDTDFFTILTNALEKDPDVLFIGGPSEPTAKLAKQARELGFKGGFIVMDQAKLDEMKAVTDNSYEMLEGAIGTIPLVDAGYPGTDQFVEKYREKYGSDPGAEAGFHYMSVYIFVEAMKAAGSVDNPTEIHKHIQDALDALPDDKKVYEVPSIDEKGGFVIPVRVAAIEEGKIVYIE